MKLSLRNFDFFLFLPALFLLGFSVVTIISVSPANIDNHLLYLVFAIFFFFIFSFIDIKTLFPFSPVIYLVSLLFLITPFLFGTITRGSVRWIPIGNFTIQPSELVKPFLALFASWFWADKKFNFKEFIFFCLLFSPSLALIFLQPDLGSSLVVLSILVGVILYSGAKKKQLFLIIAVTIALIPFFWLTLKEYQKLRVVHFLNPYSDPLGEGYNIIQAKIAVGSGGFLGKGFGKGTQSHLAFLPERHTDFVFASLAEELGFVGSAAVLVLYFLLLLRILQIAKQQKERHLFLLCMALFSSLSFQIMVNIGMNIGLLPITGITLPLLSYGGSSVLATMIALGILENLSRNSKREEIIEIK